jgi:hypothetical protein
MSAEHTEDRTFYHGTGSAAAKSILASDLKGSPLEKIGAFTLAREIYQAILKHAGLPRSDAWQLYAPLSKKLGTGVPALEREALWRSAFSQLDEDTDWALFVYGHFCATLNIANAYRYTIRNPFRSEFVLALADGLRVIQLLGEQLPETVSTRYPEVDRLIKNPSPPVVLELRGITQERLQQDNGGGNVSDELKTFDLMQKHSGSSNVPAAFRIKGVTSADIIAVHDVSGWAPEELDNGFWRPDAERVAASRYSVKDWLDLEADRVPAGGSD